MFKIGFTLKDNRLPKVLVGRRLVVLVDDNQLAAVVRDLADVSDLNIKTMTSGPLMVTTPPKPVKAKAKRAKIKSSRPKYKTRAPRGMSERGHAAEIALQIMQDQVLQNRWQINSATFSEEGLKRGISEKTMYNGISLLVAEGKLQRLEFGLYQVPHHVVTTSELLPAKESENAA